MYSDAYAVPKPKKPPRPRGAMKPVQSMPKPKACPTCGK